MKIEEIRVGNWYLSTKWKKPVICDLTDLYEIYARCDGAYDDPPVDEIFEPLLLTEEWLLKLDFRITNMKNMYIKNWGNNGVEVIIIDYHYKGGFEYQLGNAKFKKVDYVHQLQNLFSALTVEELKTK